MTECENDCPTRRSALKLSAAAGSVAVLGGCAVYGGSTAATGAGGPGDPSGDAADAAGASGGGDPSADPSPDGQDADSDAGTGEKAGGKPGSALTSTAQIPVGGGKIFAKRGVVVTQPTAGAFKAFSTECTHQGCAVGRVADGTIDCLCHGSKVKISDGSVADGPARRPLASRKIAVDGDAVTLV
jgi:Rieske Fe-S protein